MKYYYIIYCLIPFIGFFIGLILFHEIKHKEKYVVPNLINKTLEEAIEILNKKKINLNIRNITYLKEQEKSYIYNQSPLPNSIVPIQKSIIVDIKIYKNPEIPNVIGIHENKAFIVLTDSGYTVQKKYIDSIYPAGIVYAQSTTTPNRLVDIFISEPKKSSFILKNVHNYSCAEIEKTLSYHNINIKCFSTNYNEPIETIHNLNIFLQKPLPYKIIKENETIYLWHTL